LNQNITKILEYLATHICITFGIEGGEKAVCQGAVSTMAGSLLPAIAEGIMSPQRICDEYLHLCGNPHIIEQDVDTYVNNLLASKPEIIKSNDFVDNLYKKISSDPNPRETVRAI
jgi:hypothetical protein